MTDWRPTTSTNPVARRIGPMTLADIVDTSFRLFKQNWRSIVIATLLLTVPTMILNIVTYALGGATVADVFALDTTTTTPTTGSDVFADAGFTVGVILLSLATLFVDVVLSIFLAAVVARIVAASYLGQQISAGDAIKGLLKKWPALILSSILFVLALTGIAIVSSIPVIVIAVFITTPLVLTLLLVAFLALPIAVICTFLSLWIPIIAVEEAGTFRSLSRSWSLIRPRFWFYLGTLFLVVVVASVVSSLVTGFMLLIRAIVEEVLTPLAYPLVALETFASAVIFTPLLVAGLTLIYFDSRIRHEGFDLEYSAQSSNTPPATPSVQ